MPSLQAQRAADTDRYLRRHRRAYLRTVAAELGLPSTDLRDIAIREIAALAEFIAEPRRLMEATDVEETTCTCRK